MKRRIPQLLLAVVFVSAFVLAAVAAPQAGVQVLARTHLGNYVEDIAWISRGPRSGFLVGSTGYGAWGLQMRGQMNQPVHFFDVRSLSLRLPRGLTYVETEDALVYVPVEPDLNLYVADHNGRVRDIRPIQFPAGFTPVHVEGLAYIPPSSPYFPDHLALVVWETFEGGTRIEVMRRDGVVVHELLPPEPVRSSAGTGGLAFKRPDQLLIGASNDSVGTAGIWTLRLADEQWAGPPVAMPGDEFIEGIVQLGDGRVAVTHLYSEIAMFDEALNPLPGEERSLSLGMGLHLPAGVAWNPVADEYVVLAAAGEHLPGGGTDYRLSALDARLREPRLVASLGAAGLFGARTLSYIAAEAKTVVAHRTGPRALLLYDGSGVLVEQVPPPLNWRPVYVEHLPSTNEFAVVAVQDLTRVRVLDRAGAFVREFDPRPGGTGTVGPFAYFATDAGERLIFFNPDRQAVVTDLAGAPVLQFDWFEALGIVDAGDLAAISSGPHAGAFSVVDRESGEIVVFRLR